MEALPTDLTPAQSLACERLSSWVELWSTVFVVGATGCGKRVVVNHYLRNYLSSSGPTRRVLRRNAISHVARLGSKISAVGCAGLLESYLAELNETPTLMYLEDYNALYRSLTSYQTEGYDLVGPLFARFFSAVPATSRVVVTANRSTAMPHLGTHVWQLEIALNREDLDYIVDTSPLPHKEALKACYSTVTLAKLVKAINYTTKVLDPGASVEVEEVLSHFREVLTVLEVGALDVKREVTIPNVKVDMVGLESVMEQLETHVLQPFSEGLRGLPACRGVLLHGPSGTGKSTVGRWLSFRLSSRFYLLEEESGSSFEETLRTTMVRACENSPAVVFIDDIDSLVQVPSKIRALLMALDGIACKGREKVCVIATCMDLSCVNQALLRGGRLEMCLQFRTPDAGVVSRLLIQRWLVAADSLRESHQTKAELLATVASRATLVKSMSSQMLGWNCSDVIRCAETVIRWVVWGSGDCPTLEMLQEYFRTTTKSMSEHHKMCARNLVVEAPNVSYYL